MLAGFSIGSELKRFGKGRMPKIALLAIVFMPLLYGALYLWAFWNPFNEVDRLPVALVDSDRGAVVEGQPLHAGKQVADELLSRNDLDWHLVSPQEARQGVEDGDYYFSVTLPENFSAAVGSPMSDDPRQATIDVLYNDTNNYLSTVIGQNAMNQLQLAVSQTISSQAVDKVLIGLQSAGDGLQQAADGAGRLADGAATLDDGAGELDAGAHTLSEGIDAAQAGSGELADGASRLSDGIDTATGGVLALTDGLGRLSAGTDQLGAGAAQISGGVAQVVGLLDPVGQVQSDAARQVAQVADLLRGNPDPLSQQAVAALDGLQHTLATQGLAPAALDRLHQLRDGAARLSTELNDPSSQYRSGITALVDGGGALRSGLQQLSAGGHELDSGAAALHSGLGELSAGGHRLTDGTTTLAEGTEQLRSGSAELAQRLGEGAEQVPDWNEQQRKDVSSTIGAPVGVDEDSVTHAPTFGIGFAPFFLSLALYVGGIIVWMLLRPIQQRPLAGRLGALRVVFASFWPALWIVVAQAVVMYLVVRFALDLNPAYPAATFGMLLLIGATFLALIQMFNVVLGTSVGRVVTLAFLMLQLVSSGGVYPVETTSRPFQWLHPFDPMTYTVDGLRQVTLGHVDSRLWISLAVLAGVFVGSLALSALAARRDRRWTVERLHPPIEV
ncbi:YhgE/Pip domain-containing protein [Tomitella gaofuii]|uniref:YhgE/Pip domain-containing protein n=1 Tax=Tomitella gaofuii TaxID=2760083 RepID=UPI0015FBEA8A|nr:YhgE/Pip domain-containing protein [Tomitella gaofuii]